MPDWLFVLGALMGLVVALLALDWFTAGRAKRRVVRAKDQHTSDRSLGYTVIEQQGQSIERQNPFV
jgi:hypothetical protein